MDLGTPNKYQEEAVEKSTFPYSRPSKLLG